MTRAASCNKGACEATLFLVVLEAGSLCALRSLVTVEHLYSLLVRVRICVSFWTCLRRLETTFFFVVDFARAGL